MRLFERFHGRRSGSESDAGAEHAFRPMNDPGMGAAASNAGGTESGAALAMGAVVTGNFVRDLRCGVPGCGRDRDDPIHFPEG